MANNRFEGVLVQHLTRVLFTPFSRLATIAPPRQSSLLPERERRQLGAYFTGKILEQGRYTVPTPSESEQNERLRKAFLDPSAFEGLPFFEKQAARIAVQGRIQGLARPYQFRILADVLYASLFPDQSESDDLEILANGWPAKGVNGFLSSYIPSRPSPYWNDDTRGHYRMAGMFDRVAWEYPYPGPKSLALPALLGVPAIQKYFRSVWETEQHLDELGVQTRITVAIIGNMDDYVDAMGRVADKMAENIKNRAIVRAIAVGLVGIVLVAVGLPVLISSLGEGVLTATSGDIKMQSAQLSEIVKAMGKSHPAFASEVERVRQEMLRDSGVEDIEAVEDPLGVAVGVGIFGILGYLLFG